MKKIPLVFLLLTTILSCKSQNTDSVYSFMNFGVRPFGIQKSNWGIFFLANAYRIDNNICEKLKAHQWHNTPENIKKEFYVKCSETSKDSQNQFFWSQSKLTKFIIVRDTKHKLSTTSITNLPGNKDEKKKMIYWINEWNKSKPKDRLVNYSSVPLFSSDQQFVLIVRGQDVESEGGWDTIYIYKRKGDQWEIAEEIIVTTI